MNYVLTILTNGRQTCFERSVYAFFQHVRPLPSAVYVFDDGGQTGQEFVVDTVMGALHGAPHAPFAWKTGATARYENGGLYDSSPSPLGMCAAHKNCHDAAAGSEYEYAFHLEDDFVILRPVDLESLADVLDGEPTCKQMALVRCPWGREIEFGGYIPHMPGHYERRLLWPHGKPMPPAYEWPGSPHEWIATTRNWATNPALMHTSLLREFPWSPVPGCETEYGPRLIAADPDAVFGLWGWGEPWAAHIALERQPGAHGY